MYGCELWNLSYDPIEKCIIVWHKVKRRIWNLPYSTYNVLVHNLSSNISVLLEKRIIRFIHNDLCKELPQINLHCKHSCFAR